MRQLTNDMRILRALSRFDFATVEDVATAVRMTSPSQKRKGLGCVAAAGRRWPRDTRRRSQVRRALPGHRRGSRTARRGASGVRCRCAPGPGRCGRCDEAEGLARQLAERNDRCGHVENSTVCLRTRNHAPPHQFEPIEKVIPF